MEAARPVDPRRERELGSPVVDDRAAEEPLGPRVHLVRDGRRHGEEPRVHREREPEVALVVEAHRVDLAERVLAVEHPAVGTRQQGVGDVAEPRLDRGTRPRGRPGALDPLAAQVGRDVGAVEPARAGVLDAQRRARDRVARGGERDREPVPRALEPAMGALRHDLAAGVVERRQRLERGERLGRQDVRVRGLDATTELEGGCGGHAATRPRAS